MAITVLPIDASSGAPAYSAQAFRQTLSALMGAAPASRPLGASSGVRPGTPSTTVFLSGASNFTWNVAAHSGVLDVETSASAGAYLYATDGSDTGTITAADATNPRVDIVYVQVDDTVQDGSGLRQGVVGYLAGTPAASPVAPTTPARSYVLARISVPKVSDGNPSATWAATAYGSPGLGANGSMQIGGLLVQWGTATISFSAVASGAIGSQSVTWPVPFSAVPWFAIPSVNGFVSASSPAVPKGIDSLTTTTGRALFVNTSDAALTFTNLPFAWLAIGPA